MGKPPPAGNAPTGTAIVAYYKSRSPFIKGEDRAALPFFCACSVPLYFID